MSNDSDAILRFFARVQEEAAKLECVFFICDAEANDAEVGDLHAENMSGWLIPEEVADEFEEQWVQGIDHIDERWKHMFVWEEWRLDEDQNLQIDFEPVKPFDWDF